VIADQLSHIQTEDPDKEVMKLIDGFVARSEISHICYPAFACPSCGYMPPGGYYAVDPEHTFFIISLMRLNRS
jgi:hypothetical protein